MSGTEAFGAYVWAWTSRTGRVSPDTLYACCDVCQMMDGGPYMTREQAQAAVDAHNRRVHVLLEEPKPQ